MSKRRRKKRTIGSSSTPDCCPALHTTLKVVNEWLTICHRFESDIEPSPDLEGWILIRIAGRIAWNLTYITGTLCAACGKHGQGQFVSRSYYLMKGAYTLWTACNGNRVLATLGQDFRFSSENGHIRHLTLSPHPPKVIRSHWPLLTQYWPVVTKFVFDPLQPLVKKMPWPNEGRVE